VTADRDLGLRIKVPSALGVVLVLVARFRIGVADVEGVGDALVGDGALAVDAVVVLVRMARLGQGRLIFTVTSASGDSPGQE
jgi:hypothetical protein